MFVSRKQATERLSDLENLSRVKDSSEASPSVQAPSPDAKVQEGVGEGEDASLDEIVDDAETEAYAKEGVADKVETQVFKSPSMQRLNDLIGGILSPRPSRAAEATRLENARGFKEVAEYLGKDQAVSLLGKTATPEQIDPTNNTRPLIESRIRKLRASVALRSTRKLRKVVDAIDDDKIAAIESPLELGRLARDLSQVSQGMSPKENEVDGGVHFHVYRPEVRETSSYPIINISPSSSE